MVSDGRILDITNTVMELLQTLKEAEIALERYNERILFLEGFTAGQQSRIEVLEKRIRKLEDKS